MNYMMKTLLTLAMVFFKTVKSPAVHAFAHPGSLRKNVRAYREYVHGYVPNAMLTDAWEDLKRLAKKRPES